MYNITDCVIVNGFREVIDLNDFEAEKFLTMLLEGLKARRGVEPLLKRITELEEENETLRKRIDSMQADFDRKLKYINADFSREMEAYSEFCEQDVEERYREEILDLQRQVRDLKELAGLRSYD